MVAVSAADPSHKVWLLSRDCRKHGSYSQVDNPRCLLPLTVSQNSILVCDRDNRRVVAVDFSSRQSRVLAMDIAQPAGIAVDIPSRSLFIGEWGEQKRVLTYKF